MARGWTREDVLGLGRGYQPMCVLLAGAELELYDLLAEKSLSVGEVCAAVGADERGMTILLDALAGLEILEKTGEKYRLAGSLGEVLTSGGRQSVLAMIQHQGNCLRRWSELARVVKVGKPAGRGTSVRGVEKDHAAFIEAMDNISRHAAGEVIEAVARELPGGLPGVKHVLDVGGGSGTWTIAWLRKFPGARATLFDLPGVIPLAWGRLGEAGMLNRVRLVEGDFEQDALPGGADVVWLSAIIHQNPRKVNRELFKKIRAAVEAGGRLLIRDIVMEADRTRPAAGALFAVNMLTGTQSGGTFTLGELEEDLRAAGWREVRLVRRDEGMNAVVEAR